MTVQYSRAGQDTSWRTCTSIPECDDITFETIETISDPHIEEGTIYEGPVSRFDTKTREIGLSQFESVVRLMLNANAMKKSVHRNWVINDIAAGPRWMEQIDSLLRLAVASAKPTRLGDAIDVLSHPRVDLSAYAHELIRCDELLRRADSDELHILVRAAGRREDTAHLLNWAMESESDAVRGSAAEALYDCVTTKSGRLWARDALVRLSKEDVSPYVREVAAELVDQLLEALDGSDDRGGV